MKTYNDIDDILRQTNNGHLTIVAEDGRVIKNIRTKHSDVFQKLNVFFLKPKKGAPVTVIQADSVPTYLALTAMVQKYQVLGPKGQFLSPIPAAA
jgi:hypothetical protein